ncbi:MAG: 2Fe-2S iron-sulfur cluster-binding protein, partial [Pseudomonadota bacterium]
MGIDKDHKRICFELDGEAVEASHDESIWEVAKRHNIAIAHLCHRDAPGYEADGNCRACMVEINNERTLAASCIRKPEEGMIVKTMSNRARKARQMVMELLIADQPKIAHDRDSHFWEMAKLNDIAESRFPAIEKERVPVMDNSHPAMQVNLDACIQCNLCVRACRDVQVNDVIGMSYRGHESKITFDFDDPMGQSTCVACGECVQACPTGALLPSSIMHDEAIGSTKNYDREVNSV